MTKDDALKKIEENDRNNAALRAYIARADAAPKVPRYPITAERFTTASGKTGVCLGFPDDVPDGAVPILEYLLRAFIEKGGKIYDAERRIAQWRTMRFADGHPLYDEWRGNADDTYASLGEQPRVASFLGVSCFWLLDTAQDVETHKGQSLNDLMEQKADVVNPMAWLALLLSLPDPTDVSTYAARKYWENIAGLLEVDGTVFAALGDSDSDGLDAGWDNPGDSNSLSRARPVVR